MVCVGGVIMLNDKFVQIHGPFARREEIVNKIKANNESFRFVKSIGVQAEPTHLFQLNGETFEAGKTEIFQANDVQITSIMFLQDEPQTTLIDCILG